MALTSVYYDGPVTETDRARQLVGGAEYGVYGPEDFKVTAHPSIANAVLVKAGRAHGHGVTDIATEDQVVQCQPVTGAVPRWDLIVVRRNWQPALGGPSTLLALQGGTLPVIPAARKIGPGIEDDQPLFMVKWQNGTSAPVEFRDLRVWAGNGGLFAKDDGVRQYMTTIGTQIHVNKTLWTCVLGSNDLPEWAKVADSTIPDVPWTNLATVQGFTPNTTSGWPGIKYAVKNGHVYVNGSVGRANSWGADQTIAVIPSTLKPTIKVQGVGVQVEPTAGNITLDAGSGVASFFATWPLF